MCNFTALNKGGLTFQALHDYRDDSLYICIMYIRICIYTYLWYTNGNRRNPQPTTYCKEVHMTLRNITPALYVHIMVINLYPLYSSFNKVEKVYVGFVLSVRPSVDGIVSALFFHNNSQIHFKFTHVIEQFLVCRVLYCVMLCCVVLYVCVPNIDTCNHYIN